MHPVLFEVPLPRVALPLAALLVAAVLAGLAVAELGRRARATDLVVVGLVGAVLALASTRGAGGARILIAPLPVYGFGALLCAALSVGWFLTLALARRDGLRVDAVGAVYFVAALSGLVGARVLYVLTNLGDFASFPDVLAFRSGGLVFYGGAIGGAAGSALAAARWRVPWLAWADVAAPSLAVGSALGRVGCYLAGCDYGVPLPAGTPRWLARVGTFPRWPDDVAGPSAGAPAWIDHVLRRELPLDSTASLPVHPTELYESAGALLLLASLALVRSRIRFRGQVFLTYVLGYALLRFVIEILRDDPERGLHGPALAPALLFPLGLGILAACWAMGPFRVLASHSRRAVTVAGFVGAFALVRVLIRALPAAPASLSTSQWIALGSSVAASAAFHALARPSRPAGAPAA